MIWTVISWFINAILHREVVEWEIHHSDTSGPTNSVGMGANTLQTPLKLVFFLQPACVAVVSWAALTQQRQRGRAEVNSQVPEGDRFISGRSINSNLPCAFLQEWTLLPFPHMCQWSAPFQLAGTVLFLVFICTGLNIFIWLWQLFLLGIAHKQLEIWGLCVR